MWLLKSGEVGQAFAAFSSDCKFVCESIRMEKMNLLT